MKHFIYIFIIVLVLVLVLGGEKLLQAYPLDGYLHTNIQRLEGVLKVQQGKIPGKKLSAGALLDTQKVDLRLINYSEIQIPAPDADLTDRILALLGEDAKEYGISVLDITDTKAPRYAASQGDFKANPGSVGKLIVALGVFQALADIYPKDLGKRLDILRTTMVRADAFIQNDSHKVPFWAGGNKAIEYRPIRQGDSANLWTWLDWMMSASSNAAAAMVQKQLLLMNRFGKDYPVTEKVSQSFFNETPKNDLGEWFTKSIQDPITRNNLNLKTFRQGSFFTRKGKSKVPGTTSYATPQALIEFLLKLEQGKLVDPFSSREIKRLIYMTARRIRYASSPALSGAAVYFKSGSLYKCRPESGFVCKKYQGNELNLLCSVAIVEHPASKPSLHYMVAVISNVVRKNSALAHQTLATRVHQLMEKDYEKKESISGKGHSQK